MNNTIQKVACYVRVSTENQLENYSIEEQTERLKAFCKAKGFIIYKIYTDGGFSGGNTNRPALQAMLSDIKNKKFNAVIVYKLDRLSRSQKDTLTLIEDEFLAHHTDFISVSENFDTSSPFGRAMIGILSVFAQLEKDQITERFTMGRIGRSKSGLFHGGGNAPKGYVYVNGKLEIDCLEAEQVKEVFSLFLTGKSVNAVSKEMMKKYHNPAWNNAVKITNCLRNSIYIGRVKFKGAEYDGLHTPIITVEDFVRANALLDSPEREAKKTTYQKTPFRAEYMLTSLIFCEHCGARYSANHGFYKCYSRSKSSPRFVKNPNCKNKNWKIEELDTLVTNEILKIAVEHNYEKLFPKNEPKNNTTDIQAEIKKIDAQINKLIDLFQVSDMPVDVIKNKLAVLLDKKEQLKAMIEIHYEDNHFAEFEAAIQRFVAISDSDKTEEKRLLVSTIIERIIINEEKVVIIWRI